MPSIHIGQDLRPPMMIEHHLSKRVTLYNLMAILAMCVNKSDAPEPD